MPFFHSCCRDSNPDIGNANMVYQRLNDVGHPDPRLKLSLDIVFELVLLNRYYSFLYFWKSDKSFPKMYQMIRFHILNMTFQDVYTSDA